MSPKPLGRSLTVTSALLLITCLCAQVDGHFPPRRFITSVTSWWGGGNQQDTENGNTAHEWLNRIDDIKKFPLDIQKAMLNRTLNEQDVQLTGDLPKQLDDKIPAMVEFLVNGAIDVFFSKVPGVSEILRPFISVGINYLKRLFGGRRVYIPDMPPVIKCPPNQIHYADKGALSKVVTWEEPVGIDAEDGTLSNVRLIGKPSGSRFSGEEYIKYEVSDSKGKTDFCMFAITIQVIRCRQTPLEQHRINTCKGVTRYGDECKFSCVKGYTLDGPQKLTCTREGQYDWQAPTCRINTCKKPKLPHGGAKWTCSSNYNYNSVCTITCAQGFRNERTFDRAPWEQASIQCKENGEWTRLPICKDVSAPVIQNCPGYKQAFAERGTRSAKVSWGVITARDSNDGDVNVTQIKGQKSGSVFTEGAHKVSYVAVDNAGLNVTCTFFVNVKVLHCPVPILADPNINVDCPKQFSFGSACDLSCLQGVALQGSERITCEKSGETNMYWAYPGGEPKCAAKPCNALPNPPNAKFDCFTLNGGAKMCSMKCMDGFIPALSSTRQRETSCSPATGVWTNRDFQGCVKQRAATSIKKKVLVYWRAPCAPADDHTDVANVTNTMTPILKDSSLFKTCPNCKVVDVRSSCRSKRTSNLVGLRWSIVIDAVQGQASAVTSSLLDGVAAAQKDYLLKNFNTLPVIKDATRFKWVDEGEIAGCDPSYAPSPGTLFCAACGLGYQSNGNGGCERCPVNTFQDDSGDVTCIQCPNGTQTFGDGMTNFRECKGPCPAGTDSPTGFSPCRDCSIGEFNELEEQIKCRKCRPGQLTPSKGSNSSTDCYDPAGEVINFYCTNIGPDTATCSWLPPYEFNGQLLGYEIDYEDLSKLDTQNVEIPSKRVESYTFDNLKPDTDYMFTIYALNEHGRGLKNSLNIKTEAEVTTTSTITTTTTTTTVASTNSTTTTATIIEDTSATTTEQPTTPDPNACPPGTSSFNGQKTPVPCSPCSLGFFQPNSGQQQCYVCGAGLTTWFPGATSSDDCVDETLTTPTTTTTTTTTTTPSTPCPPGSVSVTGFAPGCRKCPDNKEPNADKTSCEWCLRDKQVGFKCSSQ